jgi:hypothetical protein
LISFSLSVDKLTLSVDKLMVEENYGNKDNYIVKKYAVTIKLSTGSVNP